MFFPFYVSECVSWRFFYVCGSVIWNFLVTIFTYNLYLCIYIYNIYIYIYIIYIYIYTHVYMYIYMCVCVCVCVCACVFLAWIFLQRCMAQGLVNWVFNETWTHSYLEFECFLLMFFYECWSFLFLKVCIS